MKQLTKEIFNNLESQCLIADHFNQKTLDITDKIVDILYKDHPEIKEFIQKLDKEERRILNGSIEDAILQACNESLLMGFKAGFNTAQDIHGSKCLI